MGIPKKRKFKWRMLRNISLILAVSMVFGSAVGFVYFEGVVREQKISDETAKMVQLTNQIEFMLDDVQKFAQSMLVDRELQETVALEPFASEFQRQTAYDRVANRLIFYNNLRTYVSNSMLKMESGVWYGTSYVPYSEKMPREEIIQQNSADGQPYSNVYRQNNGEPILCYQVQMRDKYRYGQQKGTLYLELYLDYFLEQIRRYAEEYHYVCLLDRNGAVLYEQDADGMLRANLDGAAEWPEKRPVRVPEGCLLCGTVGETDWKLCTLIPNQYLWERSQFVLYFFMLSFLASLSLTLIFISRTIENMVRPITDLSEWMEKFEYGSVEQLDMLHTGDEIETLYACCRQMFQKIRLGEAERVRHERLEKEMEFDIMLSQINPHYLYNVLHTVVYLASAKGQREVVEIVRALLYSLQETLNVGDQGIEATIRQELELTRCYLKIQSYRYPDAYAVDIQCETALEDCIVPKTIVQPLVENAIVHGILPGETFGHIGVRVFTEEGQLRILVEDDGVGIPAEYVERFQRGETVRSEQDRRKPIGIRNVRDRIRFLYGPAYGMELQRGAEHGTQVLMRLPLNRTRVSDTPAS